MDLDCFLRCTQFARNLFVQETSNDQRKDLTLARRQRLIAQLQVEKLLGVLLGATATCDALRDGVEKLPIVERLSEELQRPCLHRSDRHRDVAAPGDEHNRQFEAELRQACLQLEPAEIRQRSRTA